MWSLARVPNASKPSIRLVASSKGDKLPEGIKKQDLLMPLPRPLYQDLKEHCLPDLGPCYGLRLNFREKENTVGES